MRENKTETITIASHIVNYINETGDTIDELQLQEAIELGDREGTLYWNGYIVPIGHWWISNPEADKWKHQCEKLHRALKALHEKTNSGNPEIQKVIKLYEDARDNK